MQSSNMKRFLKDLNKNCAYGIYMLINKTKKAIYFGCSDNLMKSLKWHIEANCDVSKDWDFDNDDIRLELVDQFLTEQTAKRNRDCYQEILSQELNDFSIHNALN